MRRCAIGSKCGVKLHSLSMETANRRVRASERFVSNTHPPKIEGVMSASSRYVPDFIREMRITVFTVVSPWRQLRAFLAHFGALHLPGSMFTSQTCPQPGAFL